MVNIVIFSFLLEYILLSTFPQCLMLVPFVNSYQVQITMYKSHHFFSFIGVTMFIHTRADG
jgi:hypothetical protein